MRERMMDCKTCAFSVYYEGGYDFEFRKQYKGVIVNARGYGGYGHFAIRKPIAKYHNLLPKFIRKMLSGNSIMWKNDREKMHELIFTDSEKSIEIVADMKNPSCKKLTFDKNTYLDLKEHLPKFLEMVGYTFDTVEEEGCITLKINYRHYEIVSGKCVVPQGVTEIPEEMYFGFSFLEELELPEGLTRIGDKAFLGCTRLRVVTIPSSVKYIGHDAFEYCPIRDLYLHSVNPDEVQLNDAMGKWPSYDLITLHVPAGLEDAYRQHPFFKEFKDVVA